MKQILIFALFSVFAFTSCDKTSFFNPVPDSRVLINIDLNTTDITLKGINSYKIYTTPRNVSERLGYAGVLVYHGLENGYDRFYAYDLACPNEATPSVRVAVENTLFARCPKCKSKFEIYAGFGNPVEGPAKYPLKRYTGISGSDITFTIYN